MVKSPLSQLEVFGFCDPSGGKQQVIRRVRARSAIVFVGMDRLNRFFVLLAIAARWPTTELRSKLIEYGDKFKPRLFGLEANAMQSLFADLVTDEARRLKKRIPFVAVQQPTKIDKDWRIRTILQPVIAEGRLFLQENQVELKNEIMSFPMSATKDIVDALASAIGIAPQRHAAEGVQTDELSKLANYLAGTGMPQHLIQERLLEVEREIQNKNILDNKPDDVVPSPR